MSWDVAVVGAGVAGLACARRLQAAGLRVVVFDKGRGPGGRLAARRFATPLGEARADHGAQYLTAREPEFQAVLAALAVEGFAARWEARFSPAAQEARWVGAPGMNGIVRGLARDLEVRFGVEVGRVDGAPGAWTVWDRHGASLCEASAWVCAAPAEQASRLLHSSAPMLAQEAAGAHSAPCWAVLAVFDAAVDPGFDACAGGGGPLAWLARNGSKPGRVGPEVWVAHAGPEWSAAHLEEAPEAVAAALRPTVLERLGGAAPVVLLAHRWRYAQVQRAAGDAFSWDPGRGVGACGDWRLGPRIELAWKSGDALGRAIALKWK